MKIGKRDAAIVFPESGEIEIVIPKEKNMPEGVSKNVIIATIFGIMIMRGDKEVMKLFKKYELQFRKKYLGTVKEKKRK